MSYAKWVRMKLLERVEALLAVLLNETRTMYTLYRTISGSAYGSLKRTLHECLEKGLIETYKEKRLGSERRVYRITEKGKKLLNTMIG